MEGNSGNGGGGNGGSVARLRRALLQGREAAMRVVVELQGRGGQCCKGEKVDGDKGVVAVLQGRDCIGGRG